MPADTLGDTPETVVAVDRLRRGVCRVYATGGPMHRTGALVVDSFFPAEPAGFGSDAAFLWDLLNSIGGWTSVNSVFARQLTPADTGLLASAPPAVRGSGFGSPRDLAVATLEARRGRGFATVVASIVARRVQEAGWIPVWRAGEGNTASLRITQALGFTEVSWRTYVSLEKGERSSRPGQAPGSSGSAPDRGYVT